MKTYMYFYDGIKEIKIPCNITFGIKKNNKMEKINAYKTTDNVVFEEKQDAIEHQNQIDSRETIYKICNKCMYSGMDLAEIVDELIENKEEFALSFNKITNNSISGREFIDIKFNHGELTLDNINNKEELIRIIINLLDDFAKEIGY